MVNDHLSAANIQGRKRPRRFLLRWVYQRQTRAGHDRRQAQFPSTNDQRSPNC
jgi:hypothetical protein